MQTTLHPIDQYIGTKLRVYRKKKGLSQSDLAQLLGISHQLVQKYEQGSTRISVSTLYDISRVLGIAPGFFYEGFEVTSPLAADSDTIIMTDRPPHLNVLLVEDNAADEVLVRKAFDACEMEAKAVIHAVHDGVEALQWLRQPQGCIPFTTPHVILLDLHIPKKPGMEVLKELKNDRTLQHIPVIILTNCINVSEMQKTYRLHASGYILKSFDIHQFYRDIRSMAEYWLNTVILPSRTLDTVS